MVWQYTYILGADYIRATMQYSGTGGGGRGGVVV